MLFSRFILQFSCLYPQNLRYLHLPFRIPWEKEDDDMIILAGMCARFTEAKSLCDQNWTLHIGRKSLYLSDSRKSGIMLHAEIVSFLKLNISEAC